MPREVAEKGKKYSIKHLIDHKWKVTVAMNPLSKHVIHNGFTSRSNLPEPQEVQQSKAKLRSILFKNFNQNVN